MQNKKDEMAELRNLIYKYLSAWKWFVVSVLVCLVIVCGYIKIKNPVYKVNANVLVKEDEGGSVKSSSMMKSLGFGFPGSMDVQDELYTMSSFSILRQTIDSLGLYIDYSEQKYLIQNIDKYKSNVLQLSVPTYLKDTLETRLTFKVVVEENGEADVIVKDKEGVLLKVKNHSLPVSLETQYGTFTISPTDLYKPGISCHYNITLTGLDVATEEYMKEIDIFLADKKANILSLSINGTNVRKSKDLLNTLISIYNIDAMVEKNYLATNTSKFIKTRLELIGQELADAETMVEQFKKENKILDMHLESKTMLEQSAEVQTKLIEVGTQLSILEQIESHLKQSANQYDLLPTSIGIKDETAMQAVMSYNQVLLERLHILQSSHLGNPVLINLENRITALRTSVLLSIQNVKDGLVIAKNDLTKQLNVFYTRFNDAPTIEKEFLDIKRTQLIKERLVVFLMERREENELSLAVSAPKARVIDLAYKNNKPIAPKKLVLLAIALGMGLIFPIIVIYIKDLLVTTFASKEELENLTTIPVIGEICIAHDEKENVVIRKDSVTSIAELFRLIRTNLQFILNKREEKVILITSTRSGEGKSFFSLNLAMSIALTNKKVLLVGLDIRSPKLAEYIGLKDGNGITNYLADENIELSDILIPAVKHSNLDVIISGPVPPNPGELLLSDRLDNLFSKLKEQYDYILVDSAPVGMVADSFSLDRVVDMTMYVMRANYTNKNSVTYVESLLSQKRLKKVYLVVNGTTIKKGYGYGYGKK